MTIPANGRIVVVDDQLEEEALPLIRCLAKKGLAVRFYTGDPKDLPDEPPNGIRLMFLDFKLKAFEFILDTDSRLQALKGVVDRIIDKSNGPYALIGWTKHADHLLKFSKLLDPQPTLCLDLEKSSCMRDKVCDIELISKALAKKLKKLGAFKLLFLWEQLANEAAFATVNEFRSLVSGSTDTDRDLKKLLYQLAKANLERQIKGKPTAEIICNALLTLNGPLIDVLETKLNTLSHYADFGRPFSKKDAAPLGFAINAKINTRLHITKDQTVDALPGNAYDLWNIGLKNVVQEIANGALTGELAGLISKVKPCVIEVSPLCDHAQDKWMRHRIVPGFLLPVSTEKQIKHVKKGDHLYISPVFQSDIVGPDCFYILLDFRYLSECSFRSLAKRKPIFRLRKDLLVDIQSRLGKHISRPGFLSL